MDNFAKKSKKFKNIPFEYHQELTLKIDDLTNLGLGVGRHEGFVIMVPFALPGELVKVRIYANHKNYSEADLVEVLEKSQDRVEPFCKLFGSCGGCQYQHLSYAAQAKWKRKQIADLMQRIGGLENVEIKETHISPKTFGYRSKLTPHFQAPKEGKEMEIGFIMQGRRSAIVDVAQCPIASENINKFLPQIREKTKANAKNFKKGGTLLLRDANEGVITDNRASATENVGALKLKFIAGEFFQNNPFILPELLDYVKEEIKGAKYLVDAYCGVGGFALWCADIFAEATGIEISENSINCAKENAKINAITNAKFIAGSSEEIFADINYKGAETAVIMDPPRGGSDEIFLKQLVAFAPQKIVYVSCGPDTQARDLKYLSANGYKVEKIQPFDMFPQTRHIESVATLSKV